MAETSNNLPDADDDVFLSPRVIDMKAFEDLEARLRRVITHALETGQALVSLDEQAQAGLRKLEDAEPALDERSRAAATLLETLDQRVSDAETLLSRAIEKAERAERFEGDVQDTLARAEQAIQEKIAAGVERAEARLAKAGDDAEARARSVEAGLTKAVEDAARAAREQADQVRTTLAEARREAEKGADGIERRLAIARDEAANMRTPALDHLEDLCERAAALLGRDPAAPEATPSRGSMGDLVGRAESLRDDAEFAIRQLEHVGGQTDQARRLLGESLLTSVEKIDALDEKQKALHEAVRTSVDLAEQARASVESRAAELRDAMEAPLARADAEARRLTDLIERADASGREVADALDRHRESLARVDEALTRLEPWRPVVLEGKGDLPPALQQVIDHARDGIGRDVRRIAEGLREIAARADDVGERVRDEG